LDSDVGFLTFEKEDWDHGSVANNPHWRAFPTRRSEEKNGVSEEKNGVKKNGVSKKNGVRVDLLNL
jgi:hypothetical protein